MPLMKVSNANILIVPGLGNSGDAHWQTRWQQKLSTARRVEQPDWDAPAREHWTRNLAEAVNGSDRPAILIGHSLGVATVVQAVPQFRQRVAGAFLVAPPDLENPDLDPPAILGFGPYPRAPLPFPSILVASRNDPYCSYEVAEDIAGAWGSLFVDAGESGHLNTASGHGPWPEGSMTFAQFVSRLA